MSHPNTDRDERVRQLISELSNAEFEARGLARSRYHDRLFTAGRPRPTNEQFDEGWSAAKDFYTTAMRDRCVMKVRELQARFQQEAQSTDDYEYGSSLGTAAMALDEAATTLESLTLDQVEQEKEK